MYGMQSMWPGEQQSPYQNMGMGSPGFHQPNMYGSTGSFGASGNQYLDMLRSTAMGDANARVQGMRLGAMHAAPNDPSMAAFGGLAAMLGGQGDYARAMNSAGTQWAGAEHANQLQQQLMRLQAQLQMDQWRQMQPSLGQIIGGTLGNMVGSAGGSAMGSWMSPGEWWG